MPKIKDLELTLKLIPEMAKYDAFGKPDKAGPYCVVHGVWLREALTELKEFRASATDGRKRDD